MHETTTPDRADGELLALTGFAIAIVSGISADVRAEDAIQSALLALVICYIVGVVIGKCCAAIAREHIEGFARERPVGASDGAETAPVMMADTSDAEFVSASPVQNREAA